MVEARDLSLNGLARHFDQLYARRNRIYHNNGVLMTMMCLLLVEVRELQDGIRKGRALEMFSPILAKIVGWTFAGVNYFDNSFAGQSIAHWMAHKYPLRGCAYCREAICSCDPAKRPPIDLASDLIVALSDDSDLSLRLFQESLGHCYGAGNREQGMEWVLGRLFSEVAEAIAFAVKMSSSLKPVDEIEKSLALEFCDILAWSCSTANMLPIDLEQATLDHYARCCPDCGQIPCACGHLVTIRGQHRKIGIGSRIPTQ